MIFLSQTEHILQLLETCLKVASVINFLIFLRGGVHLSITERLLGLRAQFPERQAIRQASNCQIQLGSWGGSRKIWWKKVESERKKEF